MAKAVQFPRDVLNNIMSTLMGGSPLPNGWTATRMLSKIQGIHDLLDEDTDMGDLQDSLDELLEAVDNEVDIEIVEAADTSKSSKASKKKTAKKSSKKPTTTTKKSSKKSTATAKSSKASKKTAKKSTTSSKASKKKSSKKKKTASSGPAKKGVIATIVECLKSAKKSAPVSKDDILETLVEDFPDRTADAMMKTINTQVPGRLRSEKGMNIIKVDGGYYVGRSK